MDRAQKVARRLVIARGNGTVLLQACKEILNQVARLVEVAVVFTRLLVCAARGNHNLFALFQQRLDQPGLGVIGFVCNDGLSGRVLEQDVGALQIMALPGCEVKACRIAQRIDRGVNFGAQTTAATSNSLFFWIPPFAPALCW